MLNQEIEEIIVNLEINARKLATLIYHSTMPDEVKESWISMVPEMSVEQIDRLLNILEAKYLDEKTRDIDVEYKEKIKKLVDELNEKKFQEDEEFIKLLKKLSDLLDL